jgi:hypothetical protein
MKYVFPFIILLIIASCRQKEKCRFSTVTDLDNLNLRECPPGDSTHHDTMYYHNVKRFSSGFDSIRKEKGIPKLPKDFQVITSSVDNQVRWRNAEMIKKITGDSNFRQPFMQRKDIEWKNDELVYDLTNFTAMDSVDSRVWILYVRDSTNGNYVFKCGYSNKNMLNDSDAAITKSQADSILKAWKIDY